MVLVPYSRTCDQNFDHKCYNHINMSQIAVTRVLKQYKDYYLLKDSWNMTYFEIGSWNIYL